MTNKEKAINKYVKNKIFTHNGSWFEVDYIIKKVKERDDRDPFIWDPFLKRRSISLTLEIVAYRRNTNMKSRTRSKVPDRSDMISINRRLRNYMYDREFGSIIQLFNYNTNHVSIPTIIKSKKLQSLSQNGYKYVDY